ncbi:MAG: DNA primase [Phycisphaerae bacterium]|nr:DNA primase [Phycisphaerae bacterium]
MRFPGHFINQVAAATDVVDLIGQYVALKKRGKEFVGLCPFHDDKRPSLNVSPSKQIFKCFACGAGGGVFQFLMLYEKLPFPQAVRTLAERAHIPLPPEAAAPEPAGLGRNDLIALTTFAARFYRTQLRSPTGADALRYALGRGLSQESIDRFGLGYAPDSWDALLRAALAEGDGEQQLVAAGLVARREERSGCYDRFRNRLIFPIFSPAGEVIAFGGRALAAEEQAKYLNSPDTSLFDKSAQLYALNWSRQAIGSSGTVIVVEGYLDALMPLQCGVSNVVATMGTALTDRHVRLLSRYATEGVLVFDADTAGSAAAERALEIFLAQQVHVRVATVPEGKDPCDYCLICGGQAFADLAAQAPDALHYVWQKRLEQVRAAGDNLAGRRAAVEDFLRVVAQSGVYGAIDEVRRGQLAQHIAHMLNVPAADLQQQMRRLARSVPRPGQAGTAPAPTTALGSDAQREVLEVLLNRPDLLAQASQRISPEDFSDPTLRQIAQAVWSAFAAGTTRIDELLAREELSTHAGLLVELSESGERRGNYEQTLAGAVEDLVYRRGRQEMQDLKTGGFSNESLRALNQHLRQEDPRRHPKIR